MFIRIRRQSKNARQNTQAVVLAVVVAVPAIITALVMVLNPIKLVLLIAAEAAAGDLLAIAMAPVMLMKIINHVRVTVVAVAVMLATITASAMAAKRTNPVRQIAVAVAAILVTLMASVKVMRLINHVRVTAAAVVAVAEQFAVMAIVKELKHSNLVRRTAVSHRRNAQKASTGMETPVCRRAAALTTEQLISTPNSSLR